jgi:hypothetical protein
MYSANNYSNLFGQNHAPIIPTVNYKNNNLYDRNQNNLNVLPNSTSFNNINNSRKKAFNDELTYNNNTKYSDTFEMYQTKPFKKNNDDSYYCGGNSSLALRSVHMNNTPLSEMFFSSENMKRIQKKIKSKVNELSNGKYKLETDQDEQDLLIAMRAVFLDYGKNLNNHIVRQVKILNQQVLDYIMPDILTNVKQYYGYLKDISNPIQPINRPMNVNNAGRKTLPSFTTTWGL